MFRCCYQVTQSTRKINSRNMPAFLHEISVQIRGILLFFFLGDFIIWFLVVNFFLFFLYILLVDFVFLRGYFWERNTLV